MKRIDDKCKEIQEYVEELSGIIPSDLKTYKEDIVIKAACERYVEKIVEAMTDIAFLIIKYKKFQLPEDDIHAFRILFEEGILEKDLYDNVSNAKGMRNIIAHQYGKIDDEVVFESLPSLLKDTKRFIERLR